MAAVATMEVLEAASERGARKVIMSGVALNAISTVVTLLGEAETALSNIFVVGSVIANVAYAVGPTRKVHRSRRDKLPVKRDRGSRYR